MAGAPVRRKQFRVPAGPRQDDGLFGPWTMTWRVWMSSSNLVAAYRAVIVQMLRTPIGTGVAAYSDYQRDPSGRLRRTGHFFAAYALADMRTVEALSRQLHAMHSKVKGTDPTTGQHFEALEHEHLLYVHMTGWHSALVCYERFNEPLTEAERRQYWQEASIGTDHIGFPGELVPSTPEGVRAYFDTVNPSLAYSQPAMHVIEWFKKPHVDYWRDAHAIPAVQLTKAAAIPTLPRAVQRMTGLEQSPARSAAATIAMRGLVQVMDRQPALQTFRFIMPETYQVVMSARRRQAEWELEQADRPLLSRTLRLVGARLSRTG
jgi:uncharacterized protein (DUF2236 family)